MMPRWRTDTAIRPADTATIGVQGSWKRVLLVEPGPPERRDETTVVTWIQGEHFYVDLRQPEGKPDFSTVDNHAHCDDAQRRWLAQQQGFAGRLLHYESAAPGVVQVEWERAFDLHPEDGTRDIGQLVADSGGFREYGVLADYEELWQPIPGSPAATDDRRCTEILLRCQGRGELLVVVDGSHFGLAQGTDEHTLIAIGQIEHGSWVVHRASDPWLEGETLAPTSPSGLWNIATGMGEKTARKI